MVKLTTPVSLLTMTLVLVISLAATTCSKFQKITDDYLQPTDDGSNRSQVTMVISAVSDDQRVTNYSCRLLVNSDLYFTKTSDNSTSPDSGEASPMYWNLLDSATFLRGSNVSLILQDNSSNQKPIPDLFIKDDLTISLACKKQELSPPSTTAEQLPPLTSEPPPLTSEPPPLTSELPTPCPERYYWIAALSVMCGLLVLVLLLLLYRHKRHARYKISNGEVLSHNFCRRVHSRTDKEWWTLEQNGTCEDATSTSQNGKKKRFSWYQLKCKTSKCHKNPEQPMTSCVSTSAECDQQDNLSITERPDYLPMDEYKRYRSEDYIPMDIPELSVHNPSYGDTPLDQCDEGLTWSGPQTPTRTQNF